MPGLTAPAPTTRPEHWAEIRSALSQQITASGLQPDFAGAVDRLQRRHARLMALVSGERDALRSKASRRGEPRAGELVRLAYPLHPGSSWTVRQDPSGTATVEALEVLELPTGKAPAWRLRLHWDFLEPGDRVFLWYGRCGFLRLEAHTESVATDPSGQPIGRVVAEESEVLVDLEVQRGTCR